MAEHVYMYAGESVHVTFHTGKPQIADVLDWFGRDAQLSAVDDDTVQVEVKVNENAMFFWALQYGLVVEVKSPESLRSRLAEATKAMAKKYR
jgi:predicted DNA-binding transcriptional regulator YafY